MTRPAGVMPRPAGVMPRPARRTRLRLQVIWTGLCGLLMAHGCTSAKWSAPVDARTDTLRILTYNIHHGEGMDSVIDLERIARLVRDLDPDVVTLQEVDSVVERTRHVDQAEALADLTGLTPHFGRFMPYQGGAYGMALLTRWPVEKVSNWRLADGTEPRTALGVRVRAPRSGAEVMIVGIHYYETEQQRLAQAEDLERILESVSVPAVLSGDFNSTPGSEVMNYVGDRWHVLDKGDDRMTFPSWGPVREIDFVTVRPRAAFRVLTHEALDDPVTSDHRALLTDLVLVPNA